MVKWRKSTVVVLATITLLAVSGCGRTEADENSAAAGPISDGPATGELSVWALGAGGDALKEIAEDFEAINPEVKVNVTSLAWETAHDKIATAIAGGTTPDVTQIGTTWMGEFAGTGALDITPSSMETPTRFFDSAWEMIGVNGTNYGYPWYADTFAYYYRADLAEKAGVKPPTTWAELMTFTKALQGAGAEYGIYLPPSGWDWPAFTAIPMGWQAGGAVLNDDGTEFAFDTPEWREALSFYSSFFEERVAAPREYAWGEWESAMGEGVIGSFIAGPDDIGTLEGLTQGGFEDGKFGVTVLPAGEVNGHSYYGGGNLAVFKDTENRDAAWKFVDYLSQPEAQQKLYELAGSIPASVEAWELPVFNDPELLVFRKQLEATTPMPSIPTITEITAAVDEAVAAIVKGGTPVTDAVSDLQAKATRIGTGN
ncbi:extracellular solute-binding protein [Agromyces sp. NPDC058484]|uniref:extracellular solute-binding protein n=1 Tax=Agromyces sp. NPDC058484 TaxID=3346524 RepID=UPI00365D6980